MSRPLRGFVAWSSDPLLRSAYSLMASVVVTAGLGMAFWVVAARLFEPESVGRDAALIAVMMELSVVCQLNLGNAIVRFLPGLEHGTARALLGAYALSGGLGVLVGCVVVLVSPLVSADFATLRADWRLAGIYVVAQALWGWFVLQDAALVAMRRSAWVPVENAGFALLKLAALPLAVLFGVAHGVFLAWVLPVVVVLAPINYLLFKEVIPRHVHERRAARSELLRRGRRRTLSFLAQDYGAAVLAKAAVTALPLLVVATLGASANAYFYIAFVIVMALDLLFESVCTSLVAEGAFAEQKVRALARTVVRRFGSLLVGASLVTIVAAPLILLPFGETYAAESASVLRILVAASVFRAMIALFSAVARLQGRGLRILVVHASVAALLLAGAAVLVEPLGVEGVALAWLGANVLGGLTVLPSLLAFLRRPSPPSPPSAREDLVAGELAVVL